MTVDIQIEPSFTDDPYWTDHVRAVKIRESAVNNVADSLKLREFVAANEISSTDIFVQKAEHELLQRAKGMSQKANTCLFMFALFAFAFVVTFVSASSFFEIEISSFATQSLIKGIVKNATVIGIFLGIQYLLISLYRAFLHESTTLENRIHSLRLGRLYIYLKYSSVGKDDISEVRKSISAAELEKVFGWNIETSTAFKDINPEYVTKSIWSNISDIAVAALSKKDKS